MTLGLLGSALALTLVGWTPSAPPVADTSPWPERDAALPVRVDASADLLRVGRIAAFTASAARPQAIRNPFSLAQIGTGRSSERVHPPARRHSAVPVSSIAKTDDAAAPDLVGITEQETSGKLARTAVFMTRDGRVEFAGPGQTVGSGRFRVTDISADVVVILCSETGVTTRLVLQ